MGIAGKLKQRVAQHLVNRDSSVATGTSAVVLNPDYVTEVRWWEDESFVERDILEAAELVAFDLLGPVLKSRGGISQRAKSLFEDEAFCTEMLLLFEGEAAGRIVIPTLQSALERIAELEQRVTALEGRER